MVSGESIIYSNNFVLRLLRTTLNQKQRLRGGGGIETIGGTLISFLSRRKKQTGKCATDGGGGGFSTALYRLAKAPLSSGGGRWRDRTPMGDMGGSSNVDYWTATSIPDGMYPELDC